MSEEEKKREGGEKEGRLFAQKQASILGQQHHNNKHQQNAHSRLGKVWSKEKEAGNYFQQQRSDYGKQSREIDSQSNFSRQHKNLMEGQQSQQKDNRGAHNPNKEYKK